MPHDVARMRLNIAPEKLSGPNCSRKSTSTHWTKARRRNRPSMIRFPLLTITLIAMPLPAAAAQDLLDIYQLAVGHAPQLTSAHAAAKAADARYRQARGELLPHISVNASFAKVKAVTQYEGEGGVPFARGGGDNGDPGFRNQQSVSLSVSQTLFDWSAWQAMEAAALRAEKAEYNLSAAAADLIVRTADAYFNVLAARAARAAARRKAEVIKKQLDRALAAYKAGLAPITNVQEARSKLDSVQVEAIKAANKLANTRDALYLLTGMRQFNLVGAAPPYKVSPPKANSAQQWVQLAIAHNPELAAQRKALAAARQKVSQAWGARLPTVTLTASIGERERIVDFGTGNLRRITETTSIGIEVSMPLFAGGIIAASVDEAKAQAIQARQQLLATRRQIRVDTRTAYRNLQASAERVKALKQAIESAKTAVEAARAGLRMGTRNILDVLEAEMELIQRKLKLRKAWFDYVMAGLRLQELTGQLGARDVRQVSAHLDQAGPVPFQNLEQRPVDAPTKKSQSSPA